MGTNGTASENPSATPAENRRFRTFRAALEAEGLSAITCACYASDWWNVSEWFHAKGPLFRLEDVSAPRYLEYRAHRSARGVAVATLNRRLAFLRRYSRFASATEAKFRPLAEALAQISFEPVKSPVVRGLGKDEEERLVDAAERTGPMEHSLVTMLARTGMRTSEIVALVRSDVSGPAGTPQSVHVRGRREKTVVLPPRTSRALGTWLAASPGGPEDPVFSLAGAAIRTSDAAAIVSRCARAAGLRATPRLLRHTFALRYLSDHRDDADGLADALGRAQPALVRAWRNEAKPADAVPRLLEWAEPAESAHENGVASRTLFGAPVAAAQETHLPGFEFAKEPADLVRVLFVLRGRLSVRAGDISVEAHEGEAVSIPAGARCVVRALEGRPVRTLTIDVPAARIR